MQHHDLNDPTTFAGKTWYTVLVSRAVDTPSIVSTSMKIDGDMQTYKNVPYITSIQTEAEEFAKAAELQFPTYQYTVVKLVPCMEAPSVTDGLVLEIVSTFPAGETPAPEPAPE